MPDTCHLAESASETAAVRSAERPEVSKWAELKQASLDFPWD